MQILNRYTGQIIYENAEIDNIKELVEMAVRNGVSLRNVDLSYADLSGADLRGADLREVNLSYAALSFANLSGANLRSADLREVNLSYADLKGANLVGANLRDADLIDADLRDADFSRANLGRVNLSRALLLDANLRGADLPHPIYQFYLGTHHAVAQPTELRIGCEAHSWGTWLSNYAEIGRANGMSEADIRDHKKMIKLLYKRMLRETKQLHGETEDGK